MTILSCGKVTTRPYENQRGGKDRSGGFLLFISVDMVLPVFSDECVCVVCFFVCFEGWCLGVVAG